MRPVVDRRLPRSREAPGSVGCALFLLIVGAVALVIAFASVVSHVRTPLTLLIRHTMASAGKFWSEKLERAIKETNEAEKREEATQRAKERSRVEELTRRRAEELNPKEDAASLALVSKKTLQRMEQELGGLKIKGLAVAAEKGRTFRPDRPFVTATLMMKMAFPQRLAIDNDYVREESELMTLLEGDHPVLRREAIPLIETRMEDVTTVNLDPAANDPELSYISEEEATRLLTKHNASENLLASCRRLGAKMMKDKAAGQRFFDITIIPPEREKAVNAIDIVKDDRHRMTAARILLPEEASEFFANEIIFFVLKHMIYVVFARADKGTPYEKLSEDFAWLYLWAVHSERLASGHVELLLLLAKRDNEPVMRRFLVKQRQQFRLAQEEYAKSLKEQQKKADV